MNAQVKGMPEIAADLVVEMGASGAKVFRVSKALGCSPLCREPLMALTVEQVLNWSSGREVEFVGQKDERSAVLARLDLNARKFIHPDGGELQVALLPGNFLLGHLSVRIKAQFTQDSAEPHRWPEGFTQSTGGSGAGCAG